MSRSYKHTPYFGDTKDRFYKKYANQRERLLKKCIEIFKIKDDFFNNEFYKTTNLMKFINYSKIPFSADYRRED